MSGVQRICHSVRSGGKPAFPTLRFPDCSISGTLKGLHGYDHASPLISSGSRRRACPRSCARKSSSSNGEPLDHVWHCFQVWLICRCCGLQSKLDFKSCRHAVESLAVDAENFGGAFSIATGRVENVENVAPLKFVQARQSGKEIAKVIG